jgi:hypothetical protein
VPHVAFAASTSQSHGRPAAHRNCLPSSNHFPREWHPFLCHPERTRISYLTALTSATYVVLPKENHTQSTEAATLDRKSGEAEGSAVPRTSRGNEGLLRMYGLMALSQSAATRDP